MYPIYYIKNGIFQFGKKKILDNVSLYLYPRDKIALIGRNGSGKSTLLKIISGEHILDEGEEFTNKNISLKYLKQENSLNTHLNVTNYLIKESENTNLADINKIIEKLDINTETAINQSSGGEKKKILLAKILAQKPDLLLLDEPTNHLDIKAIEWLEEYIYSYKGAVICISHDKEFLRNISNKILWLHQSNLYKSEEKGFQYFEEWQEEIIKIEELKLKKLNQKLQTEQQWLLTGISARRKRNQKRLKDLYRLRDNLKFTQEKLNKNKLRIFHQIESKSKVKKVLEVDSICLKIKNKILFNNFSIDILKGEKIGIIGSNGSGKTSLIKILQKQILPNQGTVKHGTKTNISYFDQSKNNLNLDKTISENLSPEGAEYVSVNDQLIHIRSYIKNFMFEPTQLHEKIKLFSGGELTRLSLAKTFIKSGNILILDEPTNDLDLDSLEVLTEMLSEYQGTIIIVSHNRDFLNQIVTKTLILDEGKIQQYVGFPEYNFKKMNIQTEKKKEKNNKILSKVPIKNKLSYKHKRLLEILPQEIEILEKKIINLEKDISEENLVQKDYKKFISLSQELENSKNLLNIKFEEWMKIENISQ